MKFFHAGMHLVVATFLASLTGCSDSGNDPATTTGTGTGTGSGTATKTTTTTTAKLFINELQPSNQDTITDDNGKASDWIEIHNPGATAVDLKGYSIGDSTTKQVIGDTLSVPAGGFVLLWADDSTGKGPDHLGFKLSAKGGDSLTLTDPSGKAVDTVSFGVATAQNTYARFPDGSGAFIWCDKPTPATTNGSACGSP